MPILPKAKNEARLAMMVRLPEGLVEELNDIAKAAGLSRTEVVEHILRWGVPEAKKELAGSKERGR